MRARGPAIALAVALAAPALGHDDWKAPAAEKARTNPVPRSPMAVARGRVLYQKHCESCHGATGKGDGERAHLAARKPHDLADAERQQSFTDGEAFWKISTGRREEGDVIMPGFAGKIPAEDDRWRLVHYVRTFAR